MPSFLITGVHCVRPTIAAPTQDRGRGPGKRATSPFFYLWMGMPKSAFGVTPSRQRAVTVLMRV
jgi:hypothetical protein